MTTSPPSDDYCDLTTTGRRTGRPHRIEIWYATERDTMYLLAGGGRSADWVQNLTVDSGVTVEIDGEVRSARARIVMDGRQGGASPVAGLRDVLARSNGDLTGWRQRALPVVLDMDS